MRGELVSWHPWFSLELLGGGQVGLSGPDDNPIKSTAPSGRRLMKVMLLGMQLSGTV